MDSSRRMWRKELLKQQERIRTRDPPELLTLTSSAPRGYEASGRRRDLLYATDTNALAAFLALTPAIKPWPHQQAGVCFMANRIRSDGAFGRGGLFCDKMRMGKTMTVLLFILNDLQEQLSRGATRFAQPYIIICPKSLTHVWLRELSRMLPSDPLVVRTLGTGDHDGPDQPHRNFDILLTTYSSLRSSACLKVIAAMPDGYRTLFCDEGHELRNADTLAHTAIMTLRVVACWFISGTPIHNTVDNLVAALRIARVPDAAVATDELRRAALEVVYLRRENSAPSANFAVTWLDFLTVAERAYYQAVSSSLREKRLDWRRAQELYAINKLRQVCIAPALLIEEVPPPPPLVWNGQATTSATEATLRSTAAHMLTVGALGGDTRVVSAHIKASFYANQAPYVPQTPALDAAWDQFRRAVHATKRVMVPPVSTKEAFVAALLARLEKVGEKAIVFSNYCEPLDRIASQCRFRQRHVSHGGRGGTARDVALVHGKIAAADRASELNRFVNDPRVGVLLITLHLGGHGHDFTCANHVVFADPWYNPKLEEQGIARVGGSKQTREVFVYRLAVRGTIDEDVVRIADGKAELDSQHLPLGEHLSDAFGETTTDTIMMRDAESHDDERSSDPMDTSEALPPPPPPAEEEEEEEEDWNNDDLL